MPTARHTDDTSVQSDDEEEALMCGLLDDEQLKQERQRVRVLPPASDSDEEEKETGAEGVRGSHGAGAEVPEAFERLELPYVHKELDLGRKTASRSSSHLDRATGGWRLVWHFDEPFHLERAVRDLCHELAIFDRFPTYDEMRRHGWGELADAILQSRHRSDCPRSGLAGSWLSRPSHWSQDSCYCVQLLLCDRERFDAASSRLWLSRQYVLKSLKKRQCADCSPSDTQIRCVRKLAARWGLKKLPAAAEETRRDLFEVLLGLPPSREADEAMALFDLDRDLCSTCAKELEVERGQVVVCQRSIFARLLPLNSPHVL